MFRKFFEKFRPTALEDSFFGTLLFMKATRGHRSYWEGKRHFEQVGGSLEIEVFIDTQSEQNGPSQG